MQTIDTDIWRETPGLGAYGQNLALTGGTARQWTVPTGCEWVRVTYTAGVLYYKIDTTSSNNPTAVVPTGDQVTDGSSSIMILNGEARTVSAGRKVSLINATSCQVIFECRATSVKV